MLNYFRKIRNKLLIEGNLRKYLTYAAGEIVIVVIGILLALYLNNLNQNRINNKLEIQYYQRIKNQLNDDLRTLNGEINYNQNFLNQFTYARKLILLNDRSKTDTLGHIAVNMVRYSDFRRKSSIYQTLVNSGEIINISNYNITEKLQRLEELYTYINRLEDQQSTFIISQIIPDIKNVLRFYPLLIENPEAFFCYKFQNDFVILIDVSGEKEKVYKQAQDEINSIIELVNKELGI